jgi:hypothetical protein
MLVADGAAADEKMNFCRVLSGSPECDPAGITFVADRSPKHMNFYKF